MITMSDLSEDEIIYLMNECNMTREEVLQNEKLLSSTLSFRGYRLMYRLRELQFVLCKDLGIVKLHEWLIQKMNKRK
jgi:hypothetical protein